MVGGCCAEKCSRPLTVEETETKVEAKGNYKHWALLEVIHWQQQSREV